MIDAHFNVVDYLTIAATRISRELGCAIVEGIETTNIVGGDNFLFI